MSASLEKSASFISSARPIRQDRPVQQPRPARPARPAQPAQPVGKPAGKRGPAGPEQAMQRANAYLERLAASNLADSFNPAELARPLKVGVDLGTSNIVITVLDRHDQPLAYALQAARVVRDGIVVNFTEATAILGQLKSQLEQRLGLALDEAATAIPPGILPGNVRVIANVVAGAGFSVRKVIDEPAAAALMLGVRNGAVVDIGGGTTGVSLLKNGRLVYSVDEPTGGSHMTLVVAGGVGLDFEAAERFKTDPARQEQVFSMVRPVIEKMAQITKDSLREPVPALFLAGGAGALPGIETVFEKYTGIRTFKPENPLLVTPVGIALSLGRAAGTELP